MSTPLRARPLSPHLDIYRWQMGNTLSILHRLTGLALALGLPALAYFVLALAHGSASYRQAQHLFMSPVGLLWLVAWSFAFFYHLLNGIRHLFWDIGLGFERRARTVSGWVVVGGSVVLTLGLWSGLWLSDRL
ncbi:MAG TPA: succinate dehydrogenase, cytochrome b556 subunit [Steroidobacteraceae bacterium]|nr:succinate dehydrogenase, cytochrome b556 subunit [Steroidobacteraceae bacterium]